MGIMPFNRILCAVDFSPESIKAGAVNLVISGANFTELIMVQGGSVNVSGNTIKVNSTGIAVIHMVAVALSMATADCIAGLLWTASI